MLKYLLYKGKSIEFVASFGRIQRLLKHQKRKMSYASVRKVTGDERIQISFSFPSNTSTGNSPLPGQGNGVGKPKMFNLDRLETEKLGKTLARIQANVAKILTKKSKKKKKPVDNSGAAATPNTETADEDISVKVLGPNGQQIEGDVLNKLAWQEGGTLIIGKTKMALKVNVPLINKVTVPGCIMAGYSVFPKIDAEFVDLLKCQFVWFRENPRKHENDEPSEDSDWVMVHEGSSYLPSNEDVSHRLKLTCTPSDGHQEGVAKETITKDTVTAGPGFCPFESRHEHTSSHTGPESFRVMTYNILANLYADSDFSRDTLYPYCPPYALDRDYRKHLLLKEIIGYRGDVLCLQEVDRSLYVNDLLPTLDSQGYSGALCEKSGSVSEGAAMFYRTDKFRLLSQHDIVITKVLKKEPLYRDVWEKISTNQVLAEKMEERSTILQVMVLESVAEPHQRVVVGTTHLYFHPRASHIRIIQTLVCLRHLASVCERYATEGSEKPAMVFCGDLNSYPMGGVHHYIDRKQIPSTHADWYAGGREEFAEDMTFSHDLDLVSASGFPQYTNFVASFAGCLDYIYADRRTLKPGMVVPMPTHEEVTQYTALPNPVFPSDHIALVCDLEWI